MELILFQVDAFTNQLFKGNPAAVLPLEAWLPDEQLQSIALENNLSETAFFKAKRNEYHLRWFTPTIEVNLCGHATLATAHVLMEHLGQGQNGQLTFQTLSGPLRVRREQKGWYVMNFPSDNLQLIPPPSVLREALAINPIETYKGREDLLVILQDQHTIEQLKPDFRLLEKLDYRGIIVTAPGRKTDFVSRCFYPNAGIDEDPVTGSAHTTMTPYWARRLDKPELTAFQASTRSGHLRCRLLNERVEISGQAVTYMEGRIKL
jgi:PhzF family phenazine biosynthesis protein